MTIRKPSVAGKFYPADFDQLQELLKECFQTERGPGAIPSNKRDKKVLGIVAPHAGYPYSGPACAWAYHEVGNAEFPDVFIILGVNHMATDTCSSNQDWETPFGLAKCDTESARVLQENGIPINNAAHEGEHSIEVQIPFLQFVNKDNLQRMKILPILIGDENYKKHAESIRLTIGKLKRKVMIIASADFTHYGRNYSYIPFETDVQKRIKALDMEAAGYIKKMDPEGFVNYIGYNRATICGRCTIPVMLEMLKDKKVKVDLVQYYTSGDILKDHKNSVSYAAMVLKED